MRKLLVDSPGSVGSRFRAERWAVLMHLLPDFADLRVVDLGGTVGFWQAAPVRPRHVTVVNLLEPGVPMEDWVTSIRGDACSARMVLERAGLPTQFDLVISNSLLEHVGGHAKRSELAAEIRALAPRHWVQTPYRYFPVEPHWLFPLMQFLPVRLRQSVALTWPLAHTRPPSSQHALEEVLWTDLLSVTEMRAYFPDSELIHERVLGLTKSLVAVRGTSNLTGQLGGPG